MLAIPLPQLKRDLEEMLLDLQHLANALQQLRDLLPEHSDKRVTVLTLLGRLNDANKKALRGTLDNTALQTEYNAIRSDLSDFIQALEEADFDENAKREGEAASAKAPAAKQGNVLYRIPHTMPLQVETECVVRIALDEDAIVEDIMLDNQVVLKNLSRVSDLMQVELGDPAREPVFAIRSTSPAQQLITDEGYTQWFFYVEPLRVGVHPLEVKVSVLELALNQVHRKELVFRETIQIITEEAASGEDGDQPLPQPSVFKNAGQAFAFAGSAAGPGDETIHQIKGVETVVDAPKSASGNSGMRTLALFLAFIMLGSTATWAFTPPETRDWWVASLLEDDADAYDNYIKKHPDSPYREKAYFFRAERSQQLADLRAYQDRFPDGKYKEKVVARMTTLETKAIDNIRQRPSLENIRQFASEFPETERLTEVKKAAETRADNRQELLAAVEDAYVASARRKPSETKITQYLQDFPQPTRLNDIAEAAATKPDVLSKVQPAIEDAITRKVATATTAGDVRQVLPAMEKAASSSTAAKVEKMVAQNPQVRKQAKLQQEVRESSERVRQREKTASLPVAEHAVLSPEEQAWADATRANSAQAYIYFIQKFPRSIHDVEARIHIKGFNLTIKQRKVLEQEAARRLKEEN